MVVKSHRKLSAYTEPEMLERNANVEMHAQRSNASRGQIGTLRFFTSGDIIFGEMYSQDAIHTQ